MTKLLQILDIIKIALALYRRAGYEMARQKLLKEIEEKDDAKTVDAINDALSS